MSDVPAGDGPRKRGEALWKAELDEVGMRNEAARKRAHEQETVTEISHARREQHAAVAEAAMLKQLNKRIETERRERG